MWNFFRLENEHLNNCGQFRAVRDISIAPINSSDQALLQQMMDEEDGVTHRRSMSAWTRYAAAAAAASTFQSVDSVKSILLLISQGCCLQCFDAVGWAARRASGL